MILTGKRYKKDIQRVENSYKEELLMQSEKQVRKEKEQIFKQLMATRNINDYERVKAINSIDIAFSNAKDVTEYCVMYINNVKEYEANFNDTSKKDVLEKAVRDSELNLLKSIAENLGYTNIDINTIVHNSFRPRWLDERRNMDYYMLDMFEKAIKNQDIAIANFGGGGVETAKRMENVLCDTCKNKFHNLSFLCKVCKPKISALKK